VNGAALRTNIPFSIVIFGNAALGGRSTIWAESHKKSLMGPRGKLIVRPATKQKRRVVLSIERQNFTDNNVVIARFQELEKFAAKTCDRAFEQRNTVLVDNEIVFHNFVIIFSGIATRQCLLVCTQY